MEPKQELDNSLTNESNKSGKSILLTDCHSTSSKLTNTLGVTATASGAGVSIESENWNSPLKAERGSGFVTLNPFRLFLAFRNAKILTVEPVIFLYMFGTFLYFPLYQQYFFLWFSKSFINSSSLLPNGSYCLSSNETDHYGGNGTSIKVQTLSNHLGIYVSLANQIPSIIFTMIYGPLSDRIGRKPIMIIVALGATVQGLLALAIVHWNLNVYLFILTSFISGLGSHFAGVLMACFSYISDISTVKWRTYRIGVAEGMLFLAGAIAQGTGGIWFEELDCNFLPPVCLFIGCNVLLMAYVLLFLPESVTQKERERRLFNKVSSGNGCFDSFVRGFKIYFSQKTGYATWKLWACLISASVIVMVSAGSQQIGVLFLKTGDPFDLDPGTIGYQQMTAQISHMIGLLFVLPLLIALKFPDALIALIGLASSAGMNIFTGLAKLNYELFISKLFRVFCIDGLLLKGKCIEHCLFSSIVSSWCCLFELAAACLCVLLCLILPSMITGLGKYQTYSQIWLL